VLLHQVVGLRSAVTKLGAANVTLVIALITGVNLPEVGSAVVNVGKDFAAGKTLALAGLEPDNPERSRRGSGGIFLSLMKVIFCNEQNSGCFKGQPQT
jgi:hypothetical protein